MSRRVGKTPAQDGVLESPAELNAAVAALRFTGADASALAGLTSAGWTSLLTHREIVRLAIPLRQSRPEQMTSCVRSRVDGYIADNAVRLEWIKCAYSDIAQALRQVGAEHLVMNGFARWPSFTDHLCFHLQSDIDLYCPPDSIEKAREAILGLGYDLAKDRQSAADHLSRLVRCNGWRWTGNYFDPEMPPSIELRFCFWNKRAFRFGVEVEREFWSRRSDRYLDDLQFPALSLEDGLGCAALQVLRDLLEHAASPAKLYELAHFLHLSRDDEALWTSWFASHCKPLRQMEAISFCAARKIFGCVLSEPAERGSP
jgi:hypothetical protein